MSKPNVLVPALFLSLLSLLGIFSCAENLKVYQRSRSFNKGVPLRGVSDDLLEMGKRRSVLYDASTGMADTLKQTAKDRLCYVGAPVGGESCYRIMVWKDSMHWVGDSLTHVWIRKH
jgi:hypothetical protein